MFVLGILGKGQGFSFVQYKPKLLLTIITMTQTSSQCVIDRLDLYVIVDSDDGGHEIPDTFFPAPKYFVRSADKPIKFVQRLRAEADSDDAQNDARRMHCVSSLKAAMGKELSESCENPRWTASMSQRANDQWDLILDLEPVS